MAPRGWNFGPGRRRDPHEEYPFHAHIPYRFFDPRAYGRDSYDGDIGWIPGPGSPRMDDLPRQPQGRHFGRQAAPILTSRMSMDTAELLPFPRAMRKLNRQLGKTKSAYEDFQSTFNSDVENLKGYADEKVIDKLWALKLKGKKDCGDPPGEDGQEPNVPDHPYDKLLAEATYLNECLQAVRNSGVKGDLERGSKRRIDTIKRMMEKIDTHSHQILDLLNSVPNGVDYCKDLITELERLANLINPSDEANKDLYKELEGNREPDESGEEQDRGQQER